MREAAPDVMAQDAQASVTASRSLQASPDDAGRQVGPATRHGGEDVGRVGQEAEDVDDNPEPGGIGVPVELPALPDVGRAEGLNVRGRVQHGEVRADMGHIEVGRSPRCLRPVDQSRNGVVLPQDVAEVEVTVQQAVRRRRRVGSPEVNRLPPQAGPCLLYTSPSPRDRS